MLLNSLYGDNDAIVSTTGEYTAEKHLHPIQDNCWRVCNYVTNFFALYSSLVKTDMMEGLVLKKKAGILAPPISESINTDDPEGLIEIADKSPPKAIKPSSEVVSGAGNFNCSVSQIMITKIGNK